MITIEEGSALQNAASIADLMLTTDAMVAEAPMSGAGMEEMM